MAFGAWQHCLNYMLCCGTWSLEGTVMKACLGGDGLQLQLSKLSSLAFGNLTSQPGISIAPCVKQEVGSDTLQAELPFSSEILLFY